MAKISARGATEVVRLERMDFRTDGRHVRKEISDEERKYEGCAECGAIHGYEVAARHYCPSTGRCQWTGNPRPKAGERDLCVGDDSCQWASIYGDHDEEALARLTRSRQRASTSWTMREQVIRRSAIELKEAAGAVQRACDPTLLERDDDRAERRDVALRWAKAAERRAHALVVWVKASDEQAVRALATQGIRTAADLRKRVS